MSTGKIVQVIGAVVDIEFPEDAVPKINDALVAEKGGTVFEVQQQLGDNYHGFLGRTNARHGSKEHRQPDYRACRQSHFGTHHERLGRSN